MIAWRNENENEFIMSDARSNCCQYGRWWLTHNANMSHSRWMNMSMSIEHEHGHEHEHENENGGSLRYRRSRLVKNRKRKAEDGKRHRAQERYISKHEQKRILRFSQRNIRNAKNMIILARTSPIRVFDAQNVMSQRTNHNTTGGEMWIFIIETKKKTYKSHSMDFCWKISSCCLIRLKWLRETITL